MCRSLETEIFLAEREVERCSEEVSRRLADLRVAESRSTEARQRLQQLHLDMSDVLDREMRERAEAARARDPSVN